LEGLFFLKESCLCFPFCFSSLGWGVQGQQIALVMFGKDASKQLHDLFFHVRALDYSLQQFD
jgi:hypothetical protein